MTSPAEMANAIRFLTMDAVEAAQSGHPGMPMGMADVATVLFTRFLKFDATQPRWADRDRFVLSAGHGSMLLYALGYLTGYPDLADVETLRNFRQLGARTAGHPEFGHVSIAETTTGPLGQGIANAVGLALAERMLAARHGDLVDHRTYAIVGDGCLMEGISQEAISLAGHWRLSKLIVLWDDNHICIDGDTSLSGSDDQLARFAASNWAVSRVDGHDPDAIAEAIAAAQRNDRPSLIACRTTIGRGAPTKGGTEKVHGAPLGAEEIAAARRALGWPHAPFEIPAEILEAWRAAGRRGAAARTAWEAKLAAAPDRAAFEQVLANPLPAGWHEAVLAFKRKLTAEQPKWATRKSSQQALEVLTEVIPALIGGSADLTHSNLTVTKATQSVTPEDFSGRYLHYGVREHGMAAIMNGLALHGGFIPYGGTFLIFANYLWPALRMSAMMGQRVLYVLTHDSIGLGEDGPTHQPIETLAALRATPNVLVFRPCDPIETIEAYEAALDHETGPSVLALSRQTLPTLRTIHSDDNLTRCGGYILAESDLEERKVTLIATGSEVSLALDAKDLLEAKGVGTAVVSLPCWELFERQTKEYRSAVLGEGTVRVAVEALGTFGWERWVGLEGAVIGMTGFGASGPAPALYDHFGITAQAVAEAALARL